MFLINGQCIPLIVIILANQNVSVSSNGLACTDDGPTMVTKYDGSLIVVCLTSIQLCFLGPSYLIIVGNQTLINRSDMWATTYMNMWTNAYMWANANMHI